MKIGEKKKKYKKDVHYYESLYYFNVFKVHLLYGPTKPRKQTQIIALSNKSLQKGGKEIQDTAEVAVIIYV